MAGSSDTSEKDLKELLSTLPENVLAEALAEKVVSEDPSGEITEVVRTVAQEYSGPLPPPKMLEHYNEIDPGFANRIITMAEKEQTHRHSLEEMSVKGTIDKDGRGQNYALLITMLITICCTFLIHNGHELSGSILGGGTLTGLAYIFISGRKKDKSSDESANSK